MNFKMNCISNHNIMTLLTSLLRIYQNYVLYEKYEIGDCIYVIVLALFLPFLICHYIMSILFFCLIGEYRIQTYLSSDFFPQ